MVNLKKRIITWSLVFLLLFSTMIERMIPRVEETATLRMCLDAYTSIVDFSLICYWMWRVLTRFQKGSIRRYLSFIAGLIFLFLLVRNIKWNLTGPEDYALVRYTWYLMYIPMIGIPLCSFYVAMMLNKPDEYKLPRSIHVVTLGSVLLCALVLTNDLHQQVFRFHNPSNWIDKDYSYGWGYYLIFAWIAILLVSFVILLIKGCRIEKKPSIYSVLIPMTAGVIYAIFYAFGIRLPSSDITLMYSITTVATLELAMYNGLIRINTGYDQLFMESKLNAVIVDDENNTRYKSKNALPLSYEMIERSKNSSVLFDKNTVIKSHKLEAGNVVWSEDISKYNEYIEELKRNREALQYQLDLEKENYSTKERLNALSEKNRIMDKIIGENAKKLEKAKNLLDKVGDDSSHETKRATLGYTSIITTYIKRKSNLVLLAMNDGRISSEELRLSIEESLMTIKIRGVEYATNFSVVTKLRENDIYQCLDLYEEIVEDNIYDITHIMVSLRRAGSDIKFTLSFVSDKPLGEYCSITPISEGDEYTFTLTFKGEDDE